MATETVDVVMTPDGRMDRANAAKYAGYSKGTLARLATEGTGPKFIKRGKVWYRREWLDEWLNAGITTSTAGARQNEVA